MDSIMKQTSTPLTALLLALFYLTRLKSKHPSSRGSNGSSHRLLFAAIIIATKFTCDDTYDNKAWSTASIGAFTNQETNKMEREFLQYMDFGLNLRLIEWTDFLTECGSKIKHFNKGININETEFVEFSGCVIRKSDSNETVFEGHQNQTFSSDMYRLGRR